MALIEQIVAVSYPAVLAEMRRPENQWVENAALNFLEKNGFIKRVSFGQRTIEVPVDYRANPEAGVLATDQDTFSLLKTEVITSATYPVAQISVYVTWTMGDEASRPQENEKIDFARSLMENAINTHDDLIEQHIFSTSASGGTEFLGLNDLVPVTGQGTVGGIDASVETWWRNPVDTYTGGSDIDAAMTNVYLQAAKGSGGREPTVALSGASAFALFEAQQHQLQRYADAEEAKRGFKVLWFKNARFIYSRFGGDNIYFLNPKNYSILVSKEYFRDKSETIPVQGQAAKYFFVYSALQAVVSAKSRLGVVKK